MANARATPEHMDLNDLTDGMGLTLSMLLSLGAVCRRRYLPA